MKKTLCLLLLLGVLGLEASAQQLGRRGVYQVFAADYGPRSSYTLTNVIAGIGTSRWMNVVLDGGEWTITNNVTVPWNIGLVYARGSALSIGAGATVTVNTAYNEIQYAASFRASSNLYATIIYLGTESASSNLLTVVTQLIAAAGTSGDPSTNGFTAVGAITGTSFHAVSYLSATGGNTIAGSLSSAPVGTTNKIVGNNSMIGAGKDNVVSNSDSFASGRGNSVQGPTAAAFGQENTVSNTATAGFAAGYRCNVAGVYSFAAGAWANANDNYSFVWSDGLGGVDYEGNGTNTFNIKAKGGVYIGTVRVFLDTGDYSGGTLTNMTAIDWSGTAVQIGRSANGSSFGVSLGNSANAAFAAVAVGYAANGMGSGVAAGYQANAYSSGAALGSQAVGTNFGVAVGATANGATAGAAVGAAARASGDGAALGYQANGAQSAVAVGRSANGNDTGVALGYTATATKSGIAVGAFASGPNTNIAIGFYSQAAGQNQTAIGSRVTNDVNNSARLRGALYLDGGTGVYYRATFGTGAFAPIWQAGRFTGAITNRSTLVTNITYFSEGQAISNQYFGP